MRQRVEDEAAARRTDPVYGFADRNRSTATLSRGWNGNDPDRSTEEDRPSFDPPKEWDGSNDE